MSWPSWTGGPRRSARRCSPRWTASSGPPSGSTMAARWRTRSCRPPTSSRCCRSVPSRSGPPAPRACPRGESLSAGSAPRRPPERVRARRRRLGRLERLEAGSLGTSEHERALHAPYLGPLDEAPDEVAQVIHVADGHMDDEVGGAREGHHPDRLREPGALGEERLRCLPVRAALLYREDRLHRAADRGGVDLGVEPGDDAAGAELADSLEAGGGGYSHLLGERLVGLPRIVLQLVQQRPVH